MRLLLAEDERSLSRALVTILNRNGFEVDAVYDGKAALEAIESGNMSYLKKIPGIGPKAAGQIILDLQGKVTATKQTVVNQELEEAMEVLIALGYKQSEVDKVVKKLTDENLDTNGYVKKALSLIVK